MRARLHDRDGPRALTRGVALAALAVLAVAAPLAGTDAPSPVAATFALLALAILPLARVSPLRFRPRDVLLRVRPGDVHVLAGLRSFHLRARDITGATASRHGAGCALTFSLSSRRGMPVTLVLASDAEADEVRAALGLGHGGRGETSWRTEWDATAALLAWTTAAIFALGAFFATNVGEETGGVFTVLCTAAGLFALLLTWAASPAPKPGVGRRVALRPEGAYLPTPTGHCFAPYGALGRVDPADGALVCQVADDPFVLVRSRTLPAEELALIASHLVSAKRRALGEGPLAVDVRERLRVLDRGDLPLSAWLARLDGAALGGGYRGGAVEADDLRVALGDPDLDVELRVAAARVLARVDPEVRTRVADLAHTAPNAARAKALRVATGDPGELAEALAELEVCEPRASRVGGA